MTGAAHRTADTLGAHALDANGKSANTKPASPRSLVRCSTMHTQNGKALVLLRTTRVTNVLLRQRLASDHFIITEASGILNGQWHRGADCQTELPDDHPYTKLVVLLPEEPEHAFTPQAASIADAIGSSPGIAGRIHDLCAEDQVAHMGFASAPKRAAIQIIQDGNTRRHTPIRYLLGETFVINGVELPNGQTILLRDLGQSPLENLASRRRCEGSQYCPAIPGWWLPRTERIAVPSGGYLLTQWIVLVHDLTSFQTLSA